MTAVSRIRFLLPVLGAVAGIAAAGCASSGAPAGRPAAQAHSSAPAAASGVQRVTIDGTNMLRFGPATVHLHSGRVVITLKDTGAYPHNLVIPALGVTSPTVTGDPGGTSVTFTVTFPKAGSYPFHCQYHQSAGMTGTFVVS
jgi:plastocyanin